ncbi:MAG: hypothetical protein AAGK71_02125 [Pseudomonadota bacterium]
MTETTVVSKIREGGPVDWLAFVLALFFAPFCVALFTFWIYAIPVFAIFFGWPTYLLFGAPAFWLGIRYFNAGALGQAILGLAAHFVSYLPTRAYLEVTGNSPDYADFIFGFGCVFAPLWGLAFGFLYQVSKTQDRSD